MKRSVFSLLILGAFFFITNAGVSHAQFRRPDPTDAQDKPKSAVDAMTDGDGDGGFFGQLLNPMRWSDHSSYSMSVMSGGGSSMGLAMYTNTISYMMNPNVHFSADISAVYSPFATMSGLPGSNLAKSINGVYLSDARLDWKLSDNTSLMIAYIGGPGPNSMMYGMPGYGYYNQGYLLHK
jgi:hypothetical protein